MGNEPKMFISIIKPLLKDFWLKYFISNRHISFKPIAGKAKHGQEELDITLSNREFINTTVKEIPAELTDHYLLHSEIQT